MVSRIPGIRRYAWWMAAIMLVVWAGGCNAIDGIGGQCYNSATGEVLKEVEDADGEVW